MAEQSGERQVTAQVREQLINLMVPDLDPELVQLMLRRAARHAAGDHVDHEVRRDGDDKSEAAPLQECMELLALIRDSGIDRTQLRAILRLDPEALPMGGDNPHPPIQ